jgi:hypothetical protein
MTIPDEDAVDLRDLRLKPSEVLNCLTADGRVRPAVRPGYRPRMRAGDGTRRFSDAITALRDEESW